MKSLAILVSFLILIVLLSGPINYALTSKAVASRGNSRSATTIRRIFIAIIALFGIFIAINFLIINIALAFKAFAIFSIALNLYSLKREFLPNKI